MSKAAAFFKSEEGPRAQKILKEDIARQNFA
jgi:hypothetical protein